MWAAFHDESHMKKNALIVVAIVAVSVLTIAFYKVYDIHATRARVIALLQDANERLRPVLLSQATDSVGIDIEAHAAIAEKHVVTLRDMKTASVRRLADAADDALVTNREILRRHVDIGRAHARLTLNFESLAQHIKSDRGGNDWTREAVRLKALVDKDFRDYRIAVESYASLLESFPATQAKLAPYVEPALLIDEKLVGNARQQALDAYAGADQNIKRVGTLQAYRVGRAPAR